MEEGNDVALTGQELYGEGQSARRYEITSILAWILEEEAYQ